MGKEDLCHNPHFNIVTNIPSEAKKFLHVQFYTMKLVVIYTNYFKFS